MNDAKVPLLLVTVFGAILIIAVYASVPEFGSFPSRSIGSRSENSIGQRILEKAPLETGAANVVTSVVWGYRGYDTFGEVTVLFTAVVGVVALSRAAGRRQK